MGCQWPFYTITIAQRILSFALMIAPLLTILLPDTLQPPVQLIALSSVIAGVLKLCSMMGLALLSRQASLPFGSINYSPVTIIIESLMGIFLFPGIAAFDETYVVESGLLYGLIQTVVQFSSGFRSFMGPAWY